MLLLKLSLEKGDFDKHNFVIMEDINNYSHPVEKTHTPRSSPGTGCTLDFFKTEEVNLA